MRRQHRLVLKAIAQRAAEVSRLAAQFENESQRGGHGAAAELAGVPRYKRPSRIAAVIRSGRSRALNLTSL
jgi:hypothetical protein